MRLSFHLILEAGGGSAPEVHEVLLPDVHIRLLQAAAGTSTSGRDGGWVADSLIMNEQPRAMTTLFGTDRLVVKGVKHVSSRILSMLPGGNLDKSPRAHVYRAHLIANWSQVPCCGQSAVNRDPVFAQLLR